MVECEFDYVFGTLCDRAGAQVDLYQVLERSVWNRVVRYLELAVCGYCQALRQEELVIVGEFVAERQTRADLGDAGRMDHAQFSARGDHCEQCAAVGTERHVVHIALEHWRGDPRRAVEG